MRCPETVAVIGGGRWARVITEVLCGLAPTSVGISVHSPHHAHGMAEWAAGKQLAERIRVSSDWPDSNAESRSTATIVVNAARDHERAVVATLPASCAVLVEKPMALSEASAHRMISLADAAGVRVAPAHVFLFARYARNFGELVAAAGGARSLRIVWHDPAVEVRYHEEKRYDAGLPVFADVFPHVLSLIAAVGAPLPDRVENVAVRRGGAQLGFNLVGDVPIQVELARNSDRRRRLVAVESNKDSLVLDFSREPGWMSRGDERLVADPDWSTAPSPLAALLGAFLDWAGGAVADPRLDPALALAACRLTDQISSDYRAMLMPWLAESLSDASRLENDDVTYALHELLQFNQRLSGEVLERTIEGIGRAFSGTEGAARRRSLAAARDPAEAVTVLTA